MKYAAIGKIAVHLPENLEHNDLLQAEQGWDMKVIASKTGINQRYIAADDECASDLGVKAAQKLFDEEGIDPESIDFLLFCTQSPDYPLPTTSCLMQQRLGLRTNIGAFDFNLGCSGFVYGLSVADGLIRTGAVKRVLLITADTYSKYIDKSDRSLRTIFSDAGCATLIEPSDEESIRGYHFGTNGEGANTLCVNQGGARSPENALQPRGRHRWKSQLYMDGPALINFTVGAVPKVIEDILRVAELTADDIDKYILHQATRKMLELLQQRLELDSTKLPIEMENFGNTVSCTVPILIDHLRKGGRIDRNRHNVLIGFGVGWSWAGCVWKDILQ